MSPQNDPLTYIIVAGYGQIGLQTYTGGTLFSHGTALAHNQPCFYPAVQEQPGAFLDSNLATGLIYHSFNSTESGRYVFRFRDGVPLETP